jgi:hypothetical protein
VCPPYILSENQVDETAVLTNSEHIVEWMTNNEYEATNFQEDTFDCDVETPNNNYEETSDDRTNLSHWQTNGESSSSVKTG